MVEVSAANLLAANQRVVAVTQRDDALMRVLRDCGCEVVVNDCAGQGMGTSIATGIAFSQDSDGWLVALGDMPHIRPQTAAAIAEALKRRGGIVVPVFRGERGHPVAFSKEFGAALSLLTGDTGARQILRYHLQAITELPVDDPGILADIDTPEDLTAGHRP